MTLIFAIPCRDGVVVCADRVGYDGPSLETGAMPAYERDKLAQLGKPREGEPGAEDQYFALAGLAGYSGRNDSIFKNVVEHFRDDNSQQIKGRWQGLVSRLEELAKQEIRQGGPAQQDDEPLFSLPIWYRRGRQIAYSLVRIFYLPDGQVYGECHHTHDIWRAYAIPIPFGWTDAIGKLLAPRDRARDPGVDLFREDPRLAPYLTGKLPAAKASTEETIRAAAGFMQAANALCATEEIPLPFGTTVDIVHLSAAEGCGQFECNLYEPSDGAT